MKQHTPRPEDRRRDGLDVPVWADTHPACFRSEGFAEDLGEAAGEAGVDPQRTLPRGGESLLTMLGVALVGLMGAMGAAGVFAH